MPQPRGARGPRCRASPFHLRPTFSPNAHLTQLLPLRTICTGGSSARARFGAEDFMNPPAAHEDALNGPRRLADDSNYASHGTPNPLHDSNHGRKRRPRLRTKTRTRRATHDGHPALKGREGRSVSVNPPPARTAGSKDGNANAPLGARSRACASTPRAVPPTPQSCSANRRAGGAETGVSIARLILRPHVPQSEAIQPHGLGLGGVLCGRFVLRTL